MSNENSVKVFRISGTFKQGKELTSFSREILATTEENAKEKLFSHLGSNRVKRGQIKIQLINPVSFDDITDPLIDKIVKSDFKIPFEE